jgi:hypothetical protein
MKFLVAIFGIALSIWGADVTEVQSGPTSSAAIPSDVVQDSDQVEMFAPSPPGLTCAEMGWYEADEGDECSCACGHACVKKQWCGTGWCQPSYCWKCS